MTSIWHKNYSPKPSAQFFSKDHDYVLIYAKNKNSWRPRLLDRTDDMNARYDNPDDDPRGPWKPGDLSARNYYSEGTYPIPCPSGRVIPGPPSGRYWVISEPKFKEMDRDGRIWWGEDGNNVPSIKRFLSEVKAGRVPQTLWEYDEVGHTQDAKKELLDLLDFANSDDVFVTPKPVALLARVMDLATTEHSIVLDSFAGSGTTAHAVLAANAKDGGNRRFILFECEDYADTLTAERVRRVINGYSFKGTQREALHREKLTFTKLKKADALLAQVESIKNLDGHRFDKIKAEVKDGALIVTGEKQVAERTEGLGGAFTYCTLGEPVELDRLLTGESLPAVEPLSALLLHTATNQVQPVRDPADPESVDGCRYLGASTAMHLWLIYEPDLAFLQSRDAALTLSRARALAAAKPDKPNLVFAAARFVSQRILNDERLNVEFAPLPFALYRVERT